MNCNLKLAMAGIGLAGVMALDPLSAAMKGGEYLNGQWSSSDGGDRGATLTYVPKPDGSGTLFGLVFGYEGATGDNVWLQVQADLLENQFRATGSIDLIEGGNFGFPVQGAELTSIGSFEVVLNSCGNVQYTFDFDEGTGFEDTTWDLNSLTELATGEFPSCVYTQEFTGCPDFAETVSDEDRLCQLSGQFLNEDIKLTNDTTWLLQGTVEIGGDNTDSSTLTIEPGTTLIGSGVTDDFLWVARGSKIFINGQPMAPVILTSPFDGFEEGDIPLPGDVGGIAIAGNAQCNSADGNGDCFSEFARADQVLAYGGDDNADSSGSISYAQIRYAGITVADNQEINAWTFLGVGNGTNVDHIQAYQGSDDGVEFFGGTVNVKYAVFTAGQDDSIDWDEGFSGKLQYGLVAYGGEDGDHGFEAANNPENDDALPRATPVLSNITVIGAPGTGEGIRFKEGTAGQVWNSVVTGFDSSCLHLTDRPTYTAAGTPATPTGITAFSGMILDDCGNQVFRQDDDAPWDVEDFFNAFPGNAVTDPMLDGFQPMVGSPARTGGLRVVDLATGEPVEFFENTPFRGAFDGEEDWTRGWTYDPLGQLIDAQ